VIAGVCPDRRERPVFRRGQVQFLKIPNIQPEIFSLSENRSLVRRIKQHVTGKNHAFFAVTPPHVNRVCADEIRSLFGGDLEILAGGVEFEGKLHACYEANLKLRTANRILMRIGSVEATNFGKLEKRSVAFPWELYLGPEMDIRLSISTQRCRLFHTEAIGEQILSAIHHRLASAGPALGSPNPQFTQTVFIRGVEDRFFISLDTSGEILYKRGIKTHGGRAPLRETTVAAILRMAGYTGGSLFLDPMCGSGTSAIEAAMIAGRVPAGWFREFAFMHWPSFNPPALDHMKKLALQRMIAPESPPVFASDIDPDTVNRLEKTIITRDLDKLLRTGCKSFFDLGPVDVGKRPGMVFINPPYGIRMGTRPDAERLFREILLKLTSDFRNWTSILIALNQKLTRAIPFTHEVRPIFHGGLNLFAAIGKIP
jgi:putative N6-adenine-specific DNA methylase